MYLLELRYFSLCISRFSLFIINMSGKLYIGTSGYTYPHWVGSFYPKDLPRTKWFDFYAKNFNTVEINYTFYHIPKESTLDKWQKIAPKNFVYALKASKLITHTKKWSSAAFLLWKFLKLSELLGAHCGPILLQFPPSFANEAVLDKFFERIEPIHRIAIEFRNEALIESESVREKLAAHNISFCISSSPKIEPHFIVTADFVYMRFHGAKRMYHSSYSDDELAPFAKFAKEILSQEKNVFAYFNNDVEGYAIENAKKLRELILSEKKAR